jgi:hypothetical protein
VSSFPAFSSHAFFESDAREFIQRCRWTKEVPAPAVSTCNLLQLGRNIYSLTTSATTAFSRRYSSFTMNSGLERWMLTMSCPPPALFPPRTPEGALTDAIPSGVNACNCNRIQQGWH